MLEALAKIGGVTALTIGVFYLLYKQILQMKIFAALTANQTFAFLCLVGVLVWLIAMAALFKTDSGLSALVIGGGNVVKQGVSGSN